MVLLASAQELAVGIGDLQDRGVHGGIALGYLRRMIDTYAIRLRWKADGSKRDERGKRLFAASEARAAGWGGVAAVAEITGLARSRIMLRLEAGRFVSDPRRGEL
jgi:hypothetical protein